MTCHAPVMLAAVARLTDAGLPGVMGGLSGRAPACTALARTTPADVKPGRYRSPDQLLAILERL
jgi:hypothetical protein